MQHYIGFWLARGLNAATERHASVTKTVQAVTLMMRRESFWIFRCQS
ncbi:MAG: hypothetical protein WCJ11_04215 [Methylococcaceae bacterium]